MALRASTSAEVPKGAVVFYSKDDVIEHQWKLLRGWENRWDVWPFRFGLPIIAGTTTLCGLVLNGHFRRKLKLHKQGLLTSSFALAMTPALTTVAGHAMLITHDIFVNETKCFACLQQRALAIQIGFGFFYPLVLAPIANFMFAARHGTYRLPYWTDYKGTFQLLGKIIKSGRSKLFGLLVGQAFIISYITYAEKNTLAEFHEKLLRLEKEIEDAREEERLSKEFETAIKNN